MTEKRFWKSGESTPIMKNKYYICLLYTSMQATSAESNVGNISASLGKRVKVLTKFVKDSAIAEFIKAELRRRNLEYEGLEIPQGGPFGCRHQFNIADSGYGRRGPVVQNDRAGEVACTLSAQDFDLERIFHEEGCRILHFSGLIASCLLYTSLHTLGKNLPNPPNIILGHEWRCV